MPFSPRWLVHHDRETEARNVLANLRGLTVDHELVELEFLEIKAQSQFEKRTGKFDPIVSFLSTRGQHFNVLREACSIGTHTRPSTDELCFNHNIAHALQTSLRCLAHNSYIH